ncbi:MAG TPA: SDR family oxidoreductase [Solirubrobacteraceae bacterium]
MGADVIVVSGAASGIGRAICELAADRRMTVGLLDAHADRMRGVLHSEIPIGRLADPKEPALAALWLLSDEASYVTGSHLVCDGGVLARSALSV